MEYVDKINYCYSYIDCKHYNYGITLRVKSLEHRYKLEQHKTQRLGLRKLGCLIVSIEY